MESNYKPKSNSKRVYYFFIIGIIFLFSYVFSKNANPSDLEVKVWFEQTKEGDLKYLPTGPNGWFTCNSIDSNGRPIKNGFGNNGNSLEGSGINHQNLQIFDNQKRLIGVADSVQFIQADESACYANFKFSELKLPNSPIRIQTAGGAYWFIAKSDWKDGLIELNGKDVHL